MSSKTESHALCGMIHQKNNSNYHSLLSIHAAFMVLFVKEFQSEVSSRGLVTLLRMCRNTDTKTAKFVCLKNFPYC